VAAVVLRSAIFWFPLLVGFLGVQFIGAKRLVEIEAENLSEELKGTETVEKLGENAKKEQE